MNVSPKSYRSCFGTTEGTVPLKPFCRILGQDGANPHRARPRQEAQGQHQPRPRHSRVGLGANRSGQAMGQPHPRRRIGMGEAARRRRRRQEVEGTTLTEASMDLLLATFIVTVVGSSPAIATWLFGDRIFYRVLARIPRKPTILRISLGSVMHSGGKLSFTVLVHV